MTMNRFYKGDRIRVRDAGTGEILATGIALQTRGYSGMAAFQVDTSTSNQSIEDWVYLQEYNLNYVKVEVVN